MTGTREQRYRHCILVSNLTSYITILNMSLMEKLLQVSNP